MRLYRRLAVIGGFLFLLSPAAVRAGAIASPMPFIPVTPCRVVDTRGGGVFTGTYGPPALVANTPRNFDMNDAPHCPGIPSGVTAYALNFTVVNTGPGGDLRVWPRDNPPVFVTSVLNWTAGGTNIANATTIPAGTDGGITVMAAGTGAHLLVDINGYYAGGLGPFNTFLGLGAGNLSMAGASNTGIGAFALSASNNTTRNTAVGHQALSENTQGFTNTAVGADALVHNNIGSFDVALGADALTANDSGSSNVAIGTSALKKNVSGADNVAVGSSALGNNQTGSNNIVIGQSAGSAIQTGSNNIYIGNPGGSAAESGQIRIGDATLQNGTVIAGIFGGVIAGDFVVVNSGGRLGSTPSSRRFKEDIRDVGDDSEVLMKLRPVAFRYKPDVDPERLTQYGLIAEEVAEVFPELAGLDREGRPVKVRYQLLDALLLDQLQKQHRILEAQRTELESLKSQLESLKSQLAKIEACFSAENEH